MSTKELESKIAELEKRVEEIEGNTVIIESHNDALMQLVEQIIPNNVENIDKMLKSMNMMRKEYIETFENLDGFLIANSRDGTLWRLPGTSWPRFDDEGNEL